MKNIVECRKLANINICSLHGWKIDLLRLVCIEQKIEDGLYLRGRNSLEVPPQSRSRVEVFVLLSVAPPPGWFPVQNPKTELDLVQSFLLPLVLSHPKTRVWRRTLLSLENFSLILVLKHVKLQQTRPHSFI